MEKAPSIDETTIMLTVLGLIDVVMIANLLIMVIVGATKRSFLGSILKGIPTNRSGFPISMPACSK